MAFASSTAKSITEKIENNGTDQFEVLIAQQYIAGRDICFNYLAHGSEIGAYSIQQRVGSEIRFVNNHALQVQGYALAQASSYDGVMRINVRVEEDTGIVCLIESNPRF